MTDSGVLQAMVRAGWRWTDQHLILTVTVGGQAYRVAIPIQRVDAAVGACLPAAVGADWRYDSPTTSVGFWKKLTRWAKRKARPFVPKAIRRATARLERQAHRVVQRAVPILKQVVRSKALTGVLIAASFVPGAAAITAPAIAAQQAAIQAIRAAEAGYEAAKLIERGVRDPRLFARRARGLLAVKTIENKRLRALRGDRRALETVAALQRFLR